MPGCDKAASMRLINRGIIALFRSTEGGSTFADGREREPLPLIYHFHVARSTRRGRRPFATSNKGTQSITRGIGQTAVSRPVACGEISIHYWCGHTSPGQRALDLTYLSLSLSLPALVTAVAFALGGSRASRDRTWHARGKRGGLRISLSRNDVHRSSSIE